MDKIEIDKAIDAFMHPSVFTGVKPILLVAEELVTSQSVGSIVEAVWISLDSDKSFSYVSKFAVKGKIVLGKYYEPDEMEPFRGRIALVEKNNLINVVKHQKTLQEIKSFQAKRSTLLDEINRDFSELLDLDFSTEDVFLFKKKDGDWEKEFFSNFDIDHPYKVISVAEELRKTTLLLKNPKTGKTQKYPLDKNFYGFFVGSKAHISGLKLKSESYLKSIESLQDDAKEFIKDIKWLELDDLAIKEIANGLPKHPFEEYFNYIKKEDVRDVSAPEELVDALKVIIEKHMPEKNTPIGTEYISIDKLLYLFHAVIPRAEALLALKECDVVYEPPALLLGFEGEHQLPPKFLVPLSHIAKAYQRFPIFLKTCKNHMSEEFLN